VELHEKIPNIRLEAMRKIILGSTKKLNDKESVSLKFHTLLRVAILLTAQIVLHCLTKIIF
jgi:hypothetical protein